MSWVRQTLGAVLVLALGAGSARAQGWIEIQPRVGGRVEKVRSAVNVRVTGRVASVTVEEWFRNGGVALGEATYMYPLPGEAVFSNYSLWQGDQELRGEMMDAAQARGIYEAIVRARKDPALIELVGHGMIRARVFPIGPGETRKITLRYTQMLDRTGDAWRFRYAAARDVTPRSFRLQADSAERLGEPYSPTHRVTSRRDGGRLEITLSDTTWSRDLELLLPLTRGLVGVSALTHRPVGEDGFFMLLVAPGQARISEALRRDLVAVVDVSGSMSGDKIEQAKSALAQLLGTLRGTDRFRLVAFSSDVRRYAPEWTTASPEARRAAVEWVHNLTANGGTNIAGALTEAFAVAPDAEALGMVVFLTDGLPSVGESDPERLADAAERERGRYRVFTFGVGHDVNTFLLDRVAVRARGASEYVAPGGSIEQAMGALAAKTATPVLSDLTLSADHGVELYDVQPGTLPDLFGGDEVVIFGRYRGVGSGEWSLSVRGRRGGREERFTTTVHGGGSAGTEYVTQLWAARKAAALSRELRLRGNSQEVMQELRALALRYGILTEYTAYLVQEPNIVADRLRRDAVPMAAPGAQTGEEAVNRSRREASAAQSLSLDAVAADGYRVAEAKARSRHVGNRMFVLRDSVWTDLRHADTARVVTVSRYSDAYFALLRALPELVQPAALDPAVLVAGHRIAIKIGSGGASTWQAGELEDVVRKFRG
jgi:Ca-activated chloride channel family protein